VSVSITMGKFTKSSGAKRNSYAKNTTVLYVSAPEKKSAKAGNQRGTELRERASAHTA